MASSSPQPIINNGEGGNEDPKRYMTLHRAAVEGDWEAAKIFFESDSGAMFARISNEWDTALHVAAMARQTKFVKELVKLMPPEKLELKNKLGYTPFYSSVIAGDTEAAKAMVEKNSKLPQIRTNDDKIPIIQAAATRSKDLLWFLCSATKDEDPSPFQGIDSVFLLTGSILDGFYDVALYLVQQHPQMEIDVALTVLAGKPSGFMSGSGFGFWQRCIYAWMPPHVKQVSTPHYHRIGDTEDPLRSSTDRSQMPILQQIRRGTFINQVLQSLSGFLWTALKYLVPGIKQIHDAKLMHMETHELVNFICSQVILKCEYSDILSSLGMAVLRAAEFGTVEVIDLCLGSCPDVIWCSAGESLHTILDIAIIHRQVNVFKLIRGLGAYTNKLASGVDPKTGDNILHLVAKLAPSPVLNSISGAALQMQRELQWYKEVEKIVEPPFKEFKNSDEKTPRDLFTEQHIDLVKRGEKWMKSTATSCMVVATLVTTVVFAAAFTVPGGNKNDDGLPIFLKATPFMVFVIADALALFSSATSVLIFLSILTSRYAEEDFLKSLPRKLIFGLSTLFFSIATMMMAFSATFFIMLNHRFKWVSILISLLTSLPVTIFVFSHFGLLVEVLLSTYRSDVLQ